MRPRISMISLGVDDRARSNEFYENGLGFPRHGNDENVAFFSMNGTWLGLYGRKALADDAGVASEGVGFNSFTISHNVDSPEEVKAVMNQATDAGASLVKAP